MKDMVDVASAVGELKGRVPRPANAAGFEVGYGDGAFGGPPCCAASVGSGEVEGVGEVRYAENARGRARRRAGIQGPTVQRRRGQFDQQGRRAGGRRPTGIGGGRAGERCWPRSAAGGGGRLGRRGANVSDEENLIARPVRTAAAMRRRRVRLLWQRAKRRARVLRRAAQRLRPPVASTPRTVALVQAMPARGPRAARMRHASAGLSATTVAYGGEKGTPSSSSRGWTRGCAVCARARTT